jgi:MoaA/NifB/PqqE/SkfB family radical SAM enzyme
MSNFSPWQGIKVAAKGFKNYITGKPVVVSFEVTLSCNCNCYHCDLGGMIAGEKQLQPDDYRKLVKSLDLPVAQISGGEPLLRTDIVNIVKAMKQPDGLPYIILVTNGVLLNKKIYCDLHEAGMNQLSISLDFPDERHDQFRRHNGLFKHLNETVPELAQLGYHDITLNSAITRDNMKDIVPLAQKAQDWGVSISYSAYSKLRTGDENHCINRKEDLEILSTGINNLIDLKKRSSCITSSPRELRQTLKFFEQGYIPNCKAGIRFFVVTPDGSFIPCSHHRIKYSNQKDMIAGFSRNNKCGGCYVAIRSYSDQSIWTQLRDIPQYGKMLFDRR